MVRKIRNNQETKKGSNNNELRSKNRPFKKESTPNIPSPLLKEQAESSGYLRLDEAKDIEILPPSSDDQLAEGAKYNNRGDFLNIIAESDDITDAGKKHKTTKNNSLVVYDPLASYLREIQSYPEISAKDEFDLAVRYKNNKDLQAAYKLVVSNLWLVVKIAREYERAARSLFDLIQEGNIGLMEAVKSFDPYKGVRLPSYAVWWIKAYILRYLIANWRIVKIGTTQAQRKLFYNLKRERDKLEREGIVPEPKLLAQKIGVKESEVLEMEQRLANPDLSVDQPAHHDSETTILGTLADNSDDAEKTLLRQQLRLALLEGISEFAKNLNEKESSIFAGRIMIDTSDKLTLQELSDELGISKERVRQIEDRLRAKLREFITVKLGEDYSQIEL
ncbi:MAG TPA: RNA polymerase factor sigma-32 [Oligoflexia bacterium]|nr:RNA polymerase factor sigma-32 [Oligoflexia bacterium]HMP26955.1 RNA polymerase factor sigma-32 [Oligoflexia bacterium]